MRSWKLAWNRGQLGKNGKLNNKVTKRPTPSLNPDEAAIRSKGLNIVGLRLIFCGSEVTIDTKQGFLAADPLLVET